MSYLFHTKENAGCSVNVSKDIKKRKGEITLKLAAL